MKQIVVNNYKYIMRYKEILNEFGRESVDPEKLRHVVKNPSAQTIVRLFKRTKEHGLRGLITDNGTLYFWDAYIMTHHAAANVLNIPYWNGKDNRLYVYNEMGDPVFSFSDDFYNITDFPSLLNSDVLCVRLGSYGLVTMNEAKEIILSLRD